jgi:hypothetical protein
MNIFYEVYVNGNRVSTDDNFNLACEEFNIKRKLVLERKTGSVVMVVTIDNGPNHMHRIEYLVTDDDIQRHHEYLMLREHEVQEDHHIEKAYEDFVPSDAINPNHYKDVVPGYQYMEMMQHMLPDVRSHLLGQVYKYLMRCGKKDDALQEIKKAKWYLDCLVLHYQTGKVHVDL